MNPSKEIRNFRKERVNHEEAAKFLGLSKSTFYRLIESGVIPKSNDGEYMLGEVTESYWRNMFESEGLTAAKTRLTTAMAEINELKLSEERGELVRTDAVIKAWCENVMKAKTKLLALPAKIAPEIIGQDLRTVKDKLESEIYQALEELADYERD